MNYDSVELDDEELKAAILEGKKRKYFKTKHQDYWQKLESKKGKKKVTELKKQKGIT